MIKLYNTRTKETEDFKPLSGNTVKMYTCGPTVYNYIHIGNFRSFIFEDILRRTLEIQHFEVQHVMNITDVGHLTDDADSGEDKMEKGAREQGKSAWDIATFYTDAFNRHAHDLNVLAPHTLCKATDHIPEQIAMVQELTDKGFTYETSEGIYFDTTQFEAYGDMANLKNQSLDAGARVDMGEKKNATDFALWKFTRAGETRQMEWDAFGKKGFPGWHVECSAMARKYLGDQFDIHCGGIDHIPVHHTNEIAQTEAATGMSPSVNFWMHNEFLNLNNQKMARSDGSGITVDTLREKGHTPLAFRYFLLQTHYRKQISFTWEALEAAETGLKNLRKQIANIEDHTEENPHLVQEFMDAVNHDLNTAEALGILQKALKENKVNKRDIATMDKILALDLLSHEVVITEITPEAQALLDMRAQAREQKDWKRSDDLRDELANMGVIVKDGSEGQEVQ